MPRKKTVQPPPLEVIDCGDFIIEIRDESCRIIGRGLDKRDQFEQKRDAILEKVVKDYFKIDRSEPNSHRYVFDIPKPRKNQKTGKTPKHHPDHYLRSGAAFARKCQEWGFADPDGPDDSALRKKMYKEILFHIEALRRALEERHRASGKAI